jgi:glutamate carboxypeptidase
VINSLAEGAAASLVLESPLPGGALKTSRKGTGTYRMDIQGRAAHAGIEPDKGVSAILELAHQVQILHDLNDPGLGTTVNVGVASGGTRPNVVPAQAEAHIDVRVTTASEADRVDQAIRNLRPVRPGAELTVTPDLRRPPMEPTPGSRQLFALAQAVAAAVGMSQLGDGATGGASDANLISALGVPTLDGLGPEGAGAHADHEHVLIESMPRRTALIAGLLTEI